MIAQAESVSPIQRQTAALDVLAQSQRLWESGMRDAATDLLREAVAAAERSYESARSSDANANLARLVRELVRMELAEGRASRAMELLIRVEPALALEADFWALRGNVAQRLERYPDSSKAYLAALKLRPGEPRWMLGAAVSLAIQGQLAAATELAEQARVVGGLSQEMKAYLQQLGVPIRE
jgi:Flp pilus assembly protein TadD